MGIPSSEWATIAFCVLVGMLCRRWPRVALYGALSAFCEVVRCHLLPLPSTPETIFADVAAFVLPTVALCDACGVPQRPTVRTLGLVGGIALTVGHFFGPNARGSFLIASIAMVQLGAALVGLYGEMLSTERSLSRWSATCIAIVGIIGVAFVGVWDDVAWAGVATHAFVCLAYLAHEEREADDAFAFAADDDGPPSSKP